MEVSGLAQASQLKRLMSEGIEVNLFIYELAIGGWTMYRATELFFISTLCSITFGHGLISSKIRCRLLTF